MAPVKRIGRLLNVNREPSRPKKRRKITLVFDEAKRKDFLTGFRKRKQERREKAKKELKLKLIAERKKIKQEVKDKYKELLSNRDIPELEQLLSQHEYEDNGKTVSILELDVNNLAQSSNYIGDNKPKQEVNRSESENEEKSEDDDEEENVPGMELKEKKTILVKEEIPRISKQEMIKEVMKKTRESKISKLQKRLDKKTNKKMSAKQKSKQEAKMKKNKKKAKRK